VGTLHHPIAFYSFKTIRSKMERYFIASLRRTYFIHRIAIFKPESYRNLHGPFSLSRWILPFLWVYFHLLVFHFPLPWVHSQKISGPEGATANWVEPTILRLASWRKSNSNSVTIRFHRADLGHSCLRVWRYPEYYSDFRNAFCFQWPGFHYNHSDHNFRSKKPHWKWSIEIGLTRVCFHCGVRH
jgi:hypothetical protein